jgi:hypothetical protein
LGLARLTVINRMRLIFIVKGIIFSQQR